MDSASCLYDVQRCIENSWGENEAETPLAQGSTTSASVSNIWLTVSK